MKNSYITAGVIVLILVLIFIFTGRKSEAPVEELLNQEYSGYEFASGKYEIITDSSLVYWEGEYITGKKELGTVKVSSGSFIVNDEGYITEGEFEIDMDTIMSEPYIERLVTHLKSSDFFEVENFPTAKFIFKKMENMPNSESSNGRYVIAGDLIVKGITKPISFTTTISSEGDNMQAIGTFALNRAEWEIKYNSESFFSDLGDRVIRDAITIGLDLKAQKVLQ